MEHEQSRFLLSVADELNRRSLHHFHEGRIEQSKVLQLQMRAIVTVDDTLFVRPHAHLRELGLAFVVVVPQIEKLLITIRLPKGTKVDHSDEAKLIGRLINREFRSDTQRPNGKWISDNRNFTEFMILFDL